MYLKYESDESGAPTAVYIDLLGRGVAVDRTVEIDSGTLVDLDAGGQVIGIEVINPLRAWPLEEVLSRFSIHSLEAHMLRDFHALQVARGASAGSLSPTKASAELQVA
jgi:uncharacterized protein YuzE